MMFNFKWKRNRDGTVRYKGTDLQKTEAVAIQELMFRALSSVTNEECKEIMNKAFRQWHDSSLDETYIEAIFLAAFSDWEMFMQLPDQKDYRYQIALQVLRDGRDKE